MKSIRIAAGGGLQPDAHAVGRGDADRRGPAHAQAANGLEHRFHVAALEMRDLGGQSRLIEQPQIAVGAAEPFERRELSWS